LNPDRQARPQVDQLLIELSPARARRYRALANYTAHVSEFPNAGSATIERDGRLVWHLPDPILNRAQVAAQLTHVEECDRFDSLSVSQ